MIDWGKYNHAVDRRGTGEEEQKSDQNSIRMLNYGKYYSPASKSNFWNPMLLHTKCILMITTEPIKKDPCGRIFKPEIDSDLVKTLSHNKFFLG